MQLESLFVPCWDNSHLQTAGPHLSVQYYSIVSLKIMIDTQIKEHNDVEILHIVM